MVDELLSSLWDLRPLNLNFYIPFSAFLTNMVSFSEPFLGLRFKRPFRAWAGNPISGLFEAFIYNLHICHPVSKKRLRTD